jgi:PAS domain S-box-containing protein
MSTRKQTLHSSQSSDVESNKYLHLYNSMNQGVVYQNAKGEIMTANAAAEKFLGLTLDEMQGRKSIDPRWKCIYQDGSDFPGDQHPAMISLKTGKPVHNQIMGVYHPISDSYVWILVSAEPIFKDGEVKPIEVFATFTDITNQIIAEKRLKHQSELQAILTEVSSSFIDTSGQTQDMVINNSLEMIGKFLKADRTYIFDYDHEEEVTNNTFEWCNEGIEPQIEFLQKTPFSFVSAWIETHFSGGAMNIPDIFELEKDDALRQILEPQGIKSLITVPIFENKKCVGFVGVDSVIDHRIYGDIDENILKIYAQLLSNLNTQIKNRREIEENRRFLEDIFQSSASIIIIKDTNGVYQMVNQKWVETTGLAREDVIGKTDFDLFPYAIAKTFFENDQNAIQNDTIIEVEELLKVSQESEPRFFLANKFPVKNHIGHIVGVCGIVNEISGRKKMELDLKETNNRLLNLVKSQTNYVIRTNLEGKLNYVNHKYIKDFGWLHESSEPLGSSGLISIMPYHHQRTMEVVTYCVNNPGEIKKVELDKPLADGSVQTTLWEFVCILNDQNEPNEIQCMGFDITTEKKANEKLRQSEEKYKTLFNDSPIGCLILKGEHFIDCNSAALAMFKSKKEELVGKSPLDISPEFQPTGEKSSLLAKNIIEQAFIEGKITFEWVIKRLDGSEFLSKIEATPINYNEEEALFITWQDITVLKEVENERIARKVAEAANTAKNRFLSNMSHEIRTPLQAIMGYSHILKRNGNLNAKQESQVTSILRSGNHLLQLIEDILQFSVIESNNIVLKERVFNLSDIMADMYLMFLQKVEEKGTYLLVPQDANQEYILADESKIRQILVNIIGNAVKFTSTGGTTVTVEHHEINQANEKLISVIVSDTGPGMTDAEIGLIFEEFKQFDLGQREGGTGLGMSISHHLVKAMGGNLNVSRNDSNGTTVRFDFVAKVVVEPSLDDISSYSDSGFIDYTEDHSSSTYHPKILIVDDNQDNRETLRELLEPMGYTIYEAIDGADGLEKAQGIEPDIILMDIRMPNMDGYASSKAIKNSAIGSKVKIIAVTASEFEKDDEKISESGLDDYIRKPFQPDSLFEIIKLNLPLDS